MYRTGISSGGYFHRQRIRIWAQKIDSLKAINEELKIKENEQKKFNSYYCRNIMYNLSEPVRQEYYLKIILLKFTDSPQNQCKAPYTLLQIFTRITVGKINQMRLSVNSFYISKWFMHTNPENSRSEDQRRRCFPDTEGWNFSKAFNLYNEKIFRKR